MIWLFAITGLAVALWFLVSPFFEHRTIHWVDHRLPHFNRRRWLREEKGKCVVALRELDFDYETGKLSKDDYKQLRAKYENKAIELMKEQDALQARWKQAEAQVASWLGTEVGPVQSVQASQMEAAPATQACPSCQTPVKGSARFCASCGTALGGFCPQCGTKAQGGDRFCANCGHGLQGAST